MDEYIHGLIDKDGLDEYMFMVSLLRMVWMSIFMVWLIRMDWMNIYL